MPPKSGELLSLREVELIDLRTGLRNDLEAMALAGYGCELVEELIGEDPGHPETYRPSRCKWQYPGNPDAF